MILIIREIHAHRRLYGLQKRPRMHETMGTRPINNPITTGNAMLLMLDMVQITHQQGHWMPGPPQTEGLQANHQKITNVLT